jgi:hypothetical protein
MRHLIAPSSMLGVDADLDPLIVAEGDACSSSKPEPQPPRYTICGFRKETIPRIRHKGDAPIAVVGEAEIQMVRI